MKKTLIALAAIAASSAAFAQSSVTLYGIVDLSVSTLKDQDGLGMLALAPATYKKTAMKSVLNGSRFGLRGSEDLGGGLKANFLMEYAVQPDEATTSMANRQAFVGLSGGFGEVRLGRQYTPYHVVQGSMDLYGNIDAPGYVVANHTRVRQSNAVQYTSPNIAGFTGTVQVGLGESTTGGATPSANNSVGFNAIYASGPLTAGFGYDKVKRPAAAATGTIAYAGITSGGTPAPLFGTNAAAGIASDSVAVWAAGAAYDFGVAKAAFEYSSLKDDQTAASNFGDLKSKGWNISVAVPMGAITAFANYGQANLEETGVAGEAKIKGMQFGANYALSKRTTGYVAYGNDKLTVDGDAASTKRTQMSVGVRHTF